MPDLSAVKARHTTLWNRQSFQKALGLNLPSLLASQLGLLVEKTEDDNAAVYIRERGHLLLVASSDRGPPPSYVPEVPLTQAAQLLGKLNGGEEDLIGTLFFTARTDAPLRLLPLRHHGQTHGLLVFLRRDGSPAPTAGAGRVRPVLQAITTLVLSIEHLLREHRRSSRLSRINRICHTLESIQDEDKLYREIVRRIQKFFSYDHVAVYLLDGQRHTLVLKNLAGKYEGITPERQTVPLNEGIVGWVATHGKTLLSNDVRQTPFFLNLTPHLIPTKAELCVPIRIDGDVMGVLNIEHSELLYFDVDDINSIEVLADRIGVAIRNAQLYAELQRSHNRLQEVVSSIGQGLMMIDRNFQVLWLNKTLKEWGYERMVGHPCFICPREGHEAGKSCPGFKTFRTGQPCKDVVKSHDGRTFAISSAPIVDGNGTVTHVLEAFDDVTEALKTRSELQFLKRELERSQQLATIGELAASIVHEVRNPVNAMVQAVGILETDLELDQEQRELMEVLKEECGRLESTLNTYLSLTPHSERAKEEALLRTVIEKVISLLTADQAIARRIRITLDLPPAMPPVRMHVHGITQVFWNLLLNAVESIDGQGTVSVRCRLGTSHIVLQIEDTGRGLGEVDMRKIFEPFYTTKDHGTGLGLAIVKRVLDDHGWSLGAERVPAGGTCFTITIPHDVHSDRTDHEGSRRR